MQPDAGIRVPQCSRNQGMAPRDQVNVIPKSRNRDPASSEYRPEIKKNETRNQENMIPNSNRIPTSRKILPRPEIPASRNGPRRPESGPRPHNVGNTQGKLAVSGGRPCAPMRESALRNAPEIKKSHPGIKKTSFRKHEIATRIPANIIPESRQSH